MDFLREEYEPPPEKPPPSVDSTARRFPSLSILCREIQRHLDGVGAVCLVHGAGLRRRNINLLDIRAEK